LFQKYGNDYVPVRIIKLHMPRISTIGWNEIKKSGLNFVASFDQEKQALGFIPKEVRLQFGRKRQYRRILHRPYVDQPLLSRMELLVVTASGILMWSSWKYLKI
jgi:hypothetical protein